MTPANQLFFKVWHENPSVVSCLQYKGNKVHLFVLIELRFEGINHLSLTTYAKGQNSNFYEKLPWQH